MANETRAAPLRTAAWRDVREGCNACAVSPTTRRSRQSMRHESQLGCMLCWMASVCASGAVKYPEHGSVSAWCAGCGLVAMVLHALQISAISRCVAASKDDKALLADEAWTKEMSAVESTVCAFLPMATDAIETHQLWWRVASGYLVAVFVAELLEDCNPWSATSTWWDISWTRIR